MMVRRFVVGMIKKKKIKNGGGGYVLESWRVNRVCLGLLGMNKGRQLPLILPLILLLRLKALIFMFLIIIFNIICD